MISIINSTSGLRAQQLKLDTIANNLANIDTLGYKSRDLTFQSILTNQVNNQTVLNREVGRQTPYGLRAGYGVRESITPYNFEQGSLKVTDVKTDFSINGDGFFQVLRPTRDENGNLVQERLLTRKGDFQLVPAGGASTDMLLTTKEGYMVVDHTGEAVRIPSGSDFRVFEDGRIQLTNRATGQVQDSPQRIGVYGVANNQALEKVGESHFRIPPQLFNQGQGQFDAVNEFVYGVNMNDPQVKTVLTQGSLEASNVNMQKEMTEMMATQRAFQFNSRALQYSDQMSDIINRIVR